MNDLKTSERNSLGQANLMNMMIWHTVAKALEYHQHGCADAADARRSMEIAL